MDCNRNERWHRSDKGLITCWEVGRRKAENYPDLARRAKKGELPILGWKGGVEKKLKKYRKIWFSKLFGTMARIKR